MVPYANGDRNQGESGGEWEGPLVVTTHERNSHGKEDERREGSHESELTSCQGAPSLFECHTVLQPPNGPELSGFGPRQEREQ